MAISKSGTRKKENREWRILKIFNEFVTRNLSSIKIVKGNEYYPVTLVAGLQNKYPKLTVLTVSNIQLRNSKSSIDQSWIPDGARE